MKKLWSTAAVLAAIVSVLGLVALFAVAVVHPLNSFGHQLAMAVAVGIVLVGLVLGPRLLPGLRGASPPGSPTRIHRLLGHARKGVIVALGCWLGLISWSAVSPGGPMPTAKTDPSSIRVVTWNILHSEEGAPPWGHLPVSNWSARKDALRTALRHTGPDILCVQEALPEQVAFLEETLPTHHRVGVGRDDGRSAGEHCAIYFNANRFERIGGDTFWLEEPTDQPSGGTGLNVKRICTWVRLRDRASGRTIRVYNIHSYLTEKSQVAAARVVLDHLAAGDPKDAVILAGDFNAPPGSRSRQLLAGAGLTDSAKLAGQPAGTRTYQWYGLRVRSLDAILLSKGWQVRNHRVLDVKPSNTFPSDHFGVLADLTFRD